VTNQYHAKTLKGLENILADELRGIGAADVTPVNRGVNFSGSVSMMYKANLYLRTALRILFPIAKFKAFDEDQLYKRIKTIDWSAHMTYKNSFAIDVVSFSKTFRNSLFLEQRIKDAIADQFRERTSLRPSVDVKNAEIRINVHVQENYFTVSLDSSGDSLHKRGYRKEMHPASLSEVLAAGMVLLSGYTGEVPFQNPMCGSATIAIEAAMIGMAIYPGITGRKYSFQYWPDYDQTLFERLLETMPPIKELAHPVTASDIDQEALRIAKINIRAAGLEDQIKVVKKDFLEMEQQSEPSLLILNPPYGERLNMDNLNDFYAHVGTGLKHKFPGSNAWILSANMEATKYIGLKPDRKITLFNGPLECRYLKYTLFAGKRKEFKES